MKGQELIESLKEEIRTLQFQGEILRVQQEESRDGILVVDSDWNILSYNQRFVNMWGIPGHVLATKDDRACIATVLDKLKDPAQFMAQVEYLMVNPTRKTQEVLELKDNRFFDRSSSPIIDSSNTLSGRIWFFRDITETMLTQEELKQQNQKLEKLVRQRTEQLEKVNEELEEKVRQRTLKLKEQKERLQVITESVPGVVIQFYVRDDGEQGIRYASSKLFETFGVEFSDEPPFLLQQLVSNIHKDHLQSFLDSVAESIQNKSRWKWKGKYVKPGGECIWIDGYALPTVRGRELCFDGLLHDITEKVEREVQRLETARQQEQLKKIESLKTMAGAIAHQFNNSMMAVQGNLELMTLSLPEGSAEYDMAIDAAKAASGASQIGSMMLSYVGQKRLQARELSFVDTIRENVKHFERNLPPSISLDVCTPEKTLYCNIDRFQMKEVVESILNNAVEAMKGGSGKITVTFGSEYYSSRDFPVPFQNGRLDEGMFAFCQIQDSGHGIKTKDVNKIFEPFYTTRFVGRGLGLALTVGIMHLHNGAIVVKSKPGKGTTVRILLPVSSASLGIVPFHDDMWSSPQSSLSGDVLLADDEPILLMVSKMMLEQLGFTVHTATDGKEAVEMFQRGDIRFRVVVLDILMPGMDGVSAMQNIRAMDPDVPVLLISGYAQNDIPFSDGSNTQPDGFMEKPVRISEMRYNLEKVLN